VATLLALLAALLLFGTLHPPRLGAAWRLGDAVRDVINRVETGHVLLLQEIDRVALALGKHRDQHVGAGHLLAARGLDVDRGALQDALEARGRLRVVAVVRHEIGQLVVDIGQDLAAQPVEIDAACAQHSNGILILSQREQQVFEGCVFVPALIGVRQGPMQ